MKKSCLVKKLSNYRDLTDDEKELLSEIQADTHDCKRGDVVRRQGFDAGMLYVVRDGWFGISRVLPDGENQLIDVKIPGDVIGLEEIGFANALTDIVALSAGTLCPFPAKQLRRIFEDYARLSELFFVIAAREQNILLERIVNLAQRQAIERTSHFILEIEHRLRGINCATHEPFDFPIMQHQMADLLGMTPVHINRTAQDLRKEGIVEWSRDSMHILQHGKLCDIAKFDPVYFEYNISWLN